MTDCTSSRTTTAEQNALNVPYRTHWRSVCFGVFLLKRILAVRGDRRKSKAREFHYDECSAAECGSEDEGHCPSRDRPLLRCFSLAVPSGPRGRVPREDR